MEMAYTRLELQVISCEELRAFNFFQKLSVFVTVSIVPGGDDPKKQLRPALQQQRHRTPTSKGGHRNPEWKHDMVFDLSDVSARDYSDLSLKFDVRLPSVVGSRSIGEVRASLQDLVDDFNGAVQQRGYHVKNDDGKRIGVLNFTYKLCGKSGEVGNELARVEPSSRAPVPGHSATNFAYLEWPDLPPQTLIRGILNYQTYSSSLLLQTTNKKDVSKASTGYGYRQSWYSMVGPPQGSC
ncbi:protein SRC2 homolog [Syzygium oleosum]|uniref:protein SRC2 homolog n=1 Tax=Syzygium oleosum TaxID=219896 RepID=UPI0024BB3A41|nr:protein SRC2 homolog [Syzygium oleosum]